MSSYVFGYDVVSKLLPQKYPFVFIDAVKEVEPGERIVCVKNVTGNEWMLAGHFPGQAIFPGVLLTEAMAQSAILMVKLGQGSENSDEKTYLLTGTKTRFFQPVVPGDQVILDCRAVKMMSMAAIVEVVVTVGDKKVAQGELTFAMRDAAQ